MGRRKGRKGQRRPLERVEAETPLLRATLGVTGAVSRAPTAALPVGTGNCRGLRGDSRFESVTGHAGAL